MSLSLRDYVTAGKASFTLKSLKSGDHYTYRVRRAKGKPDAPLFVQVLAPGEGRRFHYLGCIFPDGYRHGRKSPVKETEPEAKAFAWFWPRAESLPAIVEFHRSSKCCRCGRELTTPESIAAGVGPECAGRAGR